MGLLLDGLQLDVANAKYFDGIHFFPIITSKPTSQQRLRFLWEGMEEKVVDMEELKSSSVPTVTMTNKSQDSFVAYRGNIIRGGGQNRQILHSIVVPGHKTLQVPVQCIQAGRWNPTQNRKFSQRAGEVTSTTLRFKHKNQSATWESISEQSSHTHTVSDTRDFTVYKDCFTGSEEDWNSAEKNMSQNAEERKQREQKREHAQNMLKEMDNPVPNQVGMYVVLVDADKYVHGDIQQMSCMELFSDPEQYKKVHKEVIASFITDVVMYIQGKEIELPETTSETFQKFLEKIQKSEWQSGESIGSESRQVIPKTDHIFGESISLGNDMIHVMCSMY